ncbi:hypothetical protein J5N97_012866 [Dioscorea zingiberensis]|uniref:Phytocyanin domain-containing protein n=1 Tax=Dioscorea zingiberensis TaxID=325984 RepID=A0A9D5CR40_9LILI|nr:hypothetical protein J5N97_012866 [Dioscorea zingiberensis]
MEFKLSFSVLVFMVFISSSSHAYKFNVGGKDGWVMNPYESYNHWAERTRFQVNDTLVFKYKKGNDSVLVVRKEDYFTCNTSKPIKKFSDGNTEFKFDRSGPFFFVSGTPRRCENGEKMIVVVLAERKKKTAMPPEESSPGYRSPPPAASPSALKTSSSSGLSVCSCSVCIALMIVAIFGF